MNAVKFNRLQKIDCEVALTFFAQYEEMYSNLNTVAALAAPHTILDLQGNFVGCKLDGNIKRSVNIIACDPDKVRNDGKQCARSVLSQIKFADELFWREWTGESISAGKYDSELKEFWRSAAVVNNYIYSFELEAKDQLEKRAPVEVHALETEDEDEENDDGSQEEHHETTAQDEENDDGSQEEHHEAQDAEKNNGAPKEPKKVKTVRQQNKKLREQKIKQAKQKAEQEKLSRSQQVDVGGFHYRITTQKKTVEGYFRVKLLEGDGKKGNINDDGSKMVWLFCENNLLKFYPALVGLEQVKCTTSSMKVKLLPGMLVRFSPKQEDSLAEWLTYKRAKENTVE